MIQAEHSEVTLDGQQHLQPELERRIQLECINDLLHHSEK